MRTFPDWVFVELVNWARYCWIGENPAPLPDSHCRSIEYRYIAPWPEDEKPTARQPINIAAAEQVDLIWRQMPAQPKRVLREAFPQRWKYESTGEIARGLGMSFQEYEESFNAAGWRMADCLNGKIKRVG